MAKYERFVDQLFDENNEDSITLVNEDGEEFEFDQVALIDYDANYYAILCPVTPIEGIEEDEALVFLIDESADSVVLVNDEDVAQAVFDVYYQLLDEEDETTED